MATITIPNFLTQKVFTGLNTYNYTIGSTGPHTAHVKVEEIPVSGISIIINQNGTPMATSVAPSPLQTHIELNASLNCTAGDVISIVVSSSNINDTQLNTIKTKLIIAQGLI